MADLASSSAAKLAAVSPSATHMIDLHGTRFRSSDELDLPPCVGVVETTTEGDVELPGGVESLRCGSGWSAGPLRRGYCAAMRVVSNSGFSIGERCPP
jgi:hypothetical protein